MKKIKIAIIGAGSTYTPEIIEGLMNRKATLSVSEIVLMDIDRNKLEIVGALINRMILFSGLDTNVVLSESLDVALSGADYVLTQIRVGRLAARINDERIPLKYGLIGQETTGIGGFLKALRTIPVMMDIVHKMESLCPKANLINFSNPSGIIAQAILNNSKIKMVGLCNIPINMLRKVEELIGPNTQITYVGLNHLSWITSVLENNKEVIHTLYDSFYSENVLNKYSQLFSAIPCGYLEYFYGRTRKLNELLEKATSKTRGEECIEIENELLDIYADEDLHIKPEVLNKRGGALYSEAAVSLINAIENDLNEIHVVNLKNLGALPWMEYDDVVEIPTKITREGFHPCPVEHFNNAHIQDMMRTVKAYEKHTVNAALTGDKDEALYALAINPLIGDVEVAKKCLDEMLESNRKYLPQFFEEV